MEKSFLHNLPPEEKNRLAYIDSREDLFETKVFEIQNRSKVENNEKRRKNVLVISRNPGSANALWPVMEVLYRDDDIAMKVILDGRAQEILQSRFSMKDITPESMVLGADQVIGTPEAVLMDSSSEKGIDMYATATYHEVPIILVEDYYTSCKEYLKRLKDTNLPWPQKICVIDKDAKKLIIKDFPELEKIIEITGQPAFDRFVTEDTEQLSVEVKKELGLRSDEKIVTFVSGMDKMELVKKMSEELKKVNVKFKFTFRIHPRDNVPLEEYEKIFREAGVDYIDTRRLEMNKVGAASDLVITVISTEGLHAIYRRKPTIHITDSRFIEQYLTPPSPVTLGASVGLSDIDNFAVIIEKLLDPESDENNTLREQMEKNYPADGKNAQRVADILKEILA